MRRILFLILGIIFIFSSPAECKESSSRALFVSVIQDVPVFASRENISELVHFAKQAHIQTLFVQIYHSGQAWFPSRIADDSFYEKYHKILSEDPLGLLIHEAHTQGIQVHAWANLMSLSVNTKAYFLKKYGTDILTTNLQAKTKMEDFKIDGQYFLEPGDPRVGNDLVKIVKEILNTYPDLDGIQFDYIRYPDVHPHYGYTKVNMDIFKKTYHVKTIDEESLLWQDWRRSRVTEVLRKLVKTVRTMRPRMQVSTTGCMPYARAYYEAYQDWPSWVSGGLIDFVTIMDYSTDLTQFEKWINVIKEKTKDLSRVKIAVGAYKVVHSPEIFENEFSRCEEMGAMCAVFHYGSLLENKEFERFLINGKK